ncbi:MAG: element excision factor XisI family protein [Bacteroidota bacterium]
MDKVTKYRNIIKTALQDVYDFAPKEQDGITNHYVKDDESGHYILYQTGHRNHKWIYGAFIHVQLKENGEVWLYHDGTNLKIGDEIISKGVDEDDFVIGWQDPDTRAAVKAANYRA